MPDWTRIFPDGEHRWTMGLRRGESLASFFADGDPSGAVRAERAEWLAADAHAYAALLPEAFPALEETAELARSLGMRGDVAQYSASDLLLCLGRAWEPDFVWLNPGDDGVHRLAGGVVCFPSSWALRDKIGRPMQEIHAPVPGLNAALGRQIDLFLAKLDRGVVWTRENWSLSRDALLNHHPSRPRRRLDAGITRDEVWLRLEHQLLLKLPLSGSVLFAIRVEIVPLAGLLAVPAAAARLARIVATMSADAAVYKNMFTAREALLAILDGAARR